MTQRFGTAMAKMALLGHDAGALQDCSVVIPPPTLPAPAAAKLPFGNTASELELTVRRPSLLVFRAASWIIIGIELSVFSAPPRRSPDRPSWSG